MRRLWQAAILAGAVAAAPVASAAQDRMTRMGCQDGFLQFMQMLSAQPDLAHRQSRSVRVTPAGWCQARRSDPGFEEMEASQVIWRMQDPQRWLRDGIAPLALDVEITGLRTSHMRQGAARGHPDLNISARLRQLPDAGQVIVEQFVMDNGAGDALRMSGVIERVFLSSPAMMQVSMGSAAFKAGLFSLTLEGDYENPFAFGIDVQLVGDEAAQQAAAFEIINALPHGVFDAASRAELMAFAEDLPRPRGTLEVIAQAERPIGMLQLGAIAALTLPDAGRGSGMDRYNTLLDGVRVDVDWTPAEARAD